MSLFLSALLAPAVQLAAGAILFCLASYALRGLRDRGAVWRRWSLTWARSARALLRATPAALGLVALSLGAGSLLAAGDRSPLFFWVHPVAFTILGGPPAACCFLLLHAGRLEARGRLRPARAVVRLGGQLMIVGVLVQLILVFFNLLFLPAFRIAALRDLPLAGLSLAAGMIACGIAAFVGVLAGLSRKPRPSGYFAVAFYLAGQWGLIAAARLAAAG